MQQKDLLDLIQQYIRASYAWHESAESDEISGGPGGDMMELENRIMRRFGLPPQTWEYSDLMQREGFSLDHIERRSRCLYQKLQEAATRWLLSPIQSDKERLQEAKVNYAPIEDVLPRMGFPHTKYSGFLYYDLYLTNEIGETALLDALRTEKQWEEQTGSFLPHQYDSLKHCLPALKQAGFPYLLPYQTYLNGKGHAEEAYLPVCAFPISATYYQSRNHELQHFFLHSFLVGKNEPGFMDVIVLDPFYEETVRLRIQVHRAQLITLLRLAHYPSRTALLIERLKCLTDRKKGARELNFNFLDEEGQNLYISRCLLDICGRTNKIPPQPLRGRDMPVDFDVLSIHALHTQENSLLPVECPNDDYPF